MFLSHMIHDLLHGKNVKQCHWTQAKCSTGIRGVKASKPVWLWGQSFCLGFEHLALFYITDMHKTSIHKLVVDKLLIGTADTCFDRFRQLVKRLQVTFHLLQFFRQLLNQQTDKPLNNTVRRLHSIAVFNLNVSTYLGDSLAQLQCTGLGQQGYVGLDYQESRSTTFFYLKR